VQIFVYGPECADVRCINNDHIVSVGVAATQELDKRIQDLQETVLAQQKITQALQKMVEEQQTTIADLLAKK